MTDYEQQLASKLAEAKRTREQRAKLAVEEIKAVLFPLLADRLERTLAYGGNELIIGHYDTNNLSSITTRHLLELAVMEQPEQASGSKYIPSVFQPYLDTFKVGYNRDKEGTLYFSFVFIIKD